MTDKAAARPDPDAELTKNIATIKRGVEAKVARTNERPFFVA